jgi:hypothetical protein
LRLIQLRERRRDWRGVIDAGLAAALATICDRMPAISERVATLSPEQRQQVLHEIREALEACPANS